MDEAPIAILEWVRALLVVAAVAVVTVLVQLTLLLYAAMCGCGTRPA